MEDVPLRERMRRGKPGSAVDAATRRNVGITEPSVKGARKTTDAAAAVAIDVAIHVTNAACPEADVMVLVNPGDPTTAMVASRSARRIDEIRKQAECAIKAAQVSNNMWSKSVKTYSEKGNTSKKVVKDRREGKPSHFHST